MDNQILTHTKYNCTYHIVFIPKYRWKGYCSQIRNALNCAFRERTYSLKSKNPFAKQILHGFLPVTGTE